MYKQPLLILRQFTSNFMITNQKLAFIMNLEKQFGVIPKF